MRWYVLAYTVEYHPGAGESIWPSCAVRSTGLHDGRPMSVPDARMQTLRRRPLLFYRTTCDPVRRNLPDPRVLP